MVAAAALGLVGSATAGDFGLGGAPEALDTPLFVLDWSLPLRGAIVLGTGGTQYEASALPSITLTQRTLRGGYDIGGNAELSYRAGGQVRVKSFAVTAGANHAFDALTEASVRANLSVSQDDADASGNASNVATAPLVISGDVEANASRRFGLFALQLRGSVGRVVNGVTTYDDASTSSNDFQNITSYGGGGRLGYALTPILTAFVDGAVGYERYDAVSPSLLLKLDNTTYAGRAGLSGKWGEVLELEGSLGLVYRDFGDAGLDDFLTATYDAMATFRPDATLTLVADLSTSVGSPGSGSGASARLEYAAQGNASYLVNPWLRLRASAGWSYAELVGTANTETRYTLGTGADYLLNANTDLTADYGFSRSETTPDPAEDEHRFTFGVTVHR